MGPDDTPLVLAGFPSIGTRSTGLDFTDAHVDHEDPDGDGFSNIVEYRNDPVGVRRKAVDCNGSESMRPDSTPKIFPDYLRPPRVCRNSRPARLPHPV